MVYTALSSFRSPAQIGATRWAALLRARGADLPEQIVALYHQFAPLVGLNPDLCLAQGVEETGWFTSILWLDRRNPCGLGITAPGVLGLDYQTPLAGIRAHLGHLCCYVYNAMNCPVESEGVWGDPRHNFHDGKPALSHLQEPEPGRRWAEGPDYVAHILAILAVAGQGGGTMAQIADRAVLVWDGPNRPNESLKGFHACTAHETANEKPGADAAMHVAYVTKNGGGGASYHLVADKKESVQLLKLDEAGFHIGDGLDQADDEGYYTIGGEICVNDRAGYPAACRNMAQSFARVLKEKNRPVIDGVTLRQHGSYWSARNPQVHIGCPQHLKAARGSALDWGVSWTQFVSMVAEELEALNLGPAPVGESANRQLLFDTVAREYPGDEAARYLGALVREGKLLSKAAGFGTSDVERIAIYQKGALHTLGGYVYGFFDEAAASIDPALAPATVAGLRANGFIVLYD